MIINSDMFAKKKNKKLILFKVITYMENIYVRSLRFGLLRMYPRKMFTLMVIT